MARNQPDGQGGNPGAMNPGDFWGAPDRCREGMEGQWCDFLQQAAVARGSIAVNATFGPDWRPRWADGSSSGFAPDSAYIVGTAVLGEGRRAPLAIDVLDAGHKAFPPDQGGLDMLMTTLQCLQGDVDPRDLHIRTCDTSPVRFSAFQNRGPELYGHYQSLEQLLQDVRNDVIRIHSKVLRGRYANLREMSLNDQDVLQSGHPAEPWRILAIVGNRQPLDAKTQALLEWVAEHGPAARIHMLTWGVPLSGGIANFERVGFDPLMPEAGRVLPRKPPTIQLIAQTATEAAERFSQPEASPDFESLMPKRIYERQSVYGLEWVAGVGADGKLVVCQLDDRRPHAYIGGRSGMGKTAFLLASACHRALNYGPREVREYFFDLKDSGTDGSLLAGKDMLPHLGGVFYNIEDYEVVVDFLERLEEERERRSELFASVNAVDYKSYREKMGERGDPLPRISVTIDEIQMALKSHVGGRLLELLDRHGRLSRSAGIHLTIGSQKLPPEDEIPGAKTNLKGALDQYGLRLALARAVGVLEDNDVATRLQFGQMVVNGEAGVTHGNRVVQFTHAGISETAAAKARIAAADKSERPKVPVYNGKVKPPLSTDETYSALGPSSGILQPRAMIGKETTVKGDSAVVEFRNAPGRNLAVFGRSHDDVCDVIETVVGSLAKQHNGTEHSPQHALFRVVCANDADPQVAARVDRICRQLGATGQRFIPYTAEDAHVAVEEAASDVEGRRSSGEKRTSKEYLVIVGADSLTKEQLHGQKLAQVMAEGSAVGVHTVVSAGTPRKLTDMLADRYGSAPALSKLSEAWVTTSDLPASDVPTIGDDRPRLAPARGRVFLYDARHAGTHPRPRKLRLYDTIR